MSQSLLKSHLKENCLISIKLSRKGLTITTVMGEGWVNYYISDGGGGFFCSHSIWFAGILISHKFEFLLVFISRNFFFQATICFAEKSHSYLNSERPNVLTKTAIKQRIYPDCSCVVPLPATNKISPVFGLR